LLVDGYANLIILSTGEQTAWISMPSQQGKHTIRYGEARAVTTISDGSIQLSGQIKRGHHLTKSNLQQTKPTNIKTKTP
jgi:hypothetical protein